MLTMIHDKCDNCNGSGQSNTGDTCDHCGGKGQY